MSFLLLIKSDTDPKLTTSNTLELNTKRSREKRTTQGNNYSTVGIFNVKIECPNNIKHPLIPLKINNTTVYGVGSWQGWYCSSELFNAQKLGYKFEVLAGYIFETDNLFEKYVDELYQIKQSSDKDSPWYIIAKLLINLQLYLL
jgi:DNA polymerase type B, organellar and viral